MLDCETQPKNWYLLELLNDYLSQESFTADSVANAFVLAKRTDRLEIFSHYYRQYNKMYKKRPNQVDGSLGELFFNLIDSEVSLEAGCSNEFLYGFHSILNTFCEELDPKLIQSMIIRMLAVYNASIKQDYVAKLTLTQIEFLEELKKIGRIKRKERSGDTKANEWLVLNCRLDHLTDLDGITNLISQLLRKMVESGKFSHDLCEEITELQRIQLVTDPELIEEQTIKLITEDSIEMESIVFEAIYGSHNDVDSSEEEVGDDIENLHNPVSHSSTYLKSCHMIAFRDRHSESEGNLKDYHEINKKRLIKRAKYLSSIQTLRKYSTWWIKFCKKEFKTTLDLKRQRLTKLPFTLLSSANYFLNLDYSKEYSISLVRELKNSLRIYFERVTRDSTAMLKEYTQSKMVRNFVYLLGHLLTYFNTVENDLRLLKKHEESFKRLQNKNLVLKLALADVCLADSLICKCQSDVFALKRVFKLKTVETFHKNKSLSNTAEKRYMRAFELSAHQQIYKNIARSLSMKKKLMSDMKRKLKRGSQA